MSKKLEGNGRWESSRMMLPEHRQQFLERHKPEGSGRAQMPTAQELELVRDYALLPIMLSIVEKNRIEIDLSAYSLKKLYVTASDVLIKRMLADLAAVKKSLRERNIKVFEEEKVDSAVHYRLLCRGYEDKFAMMRDVVRAEISARIARYIAELFKPQAARKP